MYRNIPSQKWKRSLYLGDTVCNWYQILRFLCDVISDRRLYVVCKEGKFLSNKAFPDQQGSASKPRQNVGMCVTHRAVRIQWRRTVSLEKSFHQCTTRTQSQIYDTLPIYNWRFVYISSITKSYHEFYCLTMFSVTVWSLKSHNITTSASFQTTLQEKVSHVMHRIP